MGRNKVLEDILPFVHFLPGAIPTFKLILGVNCKKKKRVLPLWDLVIGILLKGGGEGLGCHLSISYEEGKSLGIPVACGE